MLRQKSNELVILAPYLAVGQLVTDCHKRSLDQNGNQAICILNFHEPSTLLIFAHLLL